MFLKITYQNDSGREDNFVVIVLFFNKVSI